jgi:phosphoserine aminotransferase
MLNMSNINNKKAQGLQNPQNVDHQMSSSLMSEKMDKRHMAKYSSGNQKNINVSCHILIFN